MINHLMYADDLVILSPSAKGLQRLVDICPAYGDIHDIKFNHAKTVCMYLPSKGNCTLNSPHISLNLQKLSFVPKFKYLGSFITQDNSDDENICVDREVIAMREAMELLRIFMLVHLL